ncbi:hypothetical protein [Stieleria varia]|nr:hypothetical protein [Stieleria varia]
MILPHFNTGLAISMLAIALLVAGCGRGDNPESSSSSGPALPEQPAQDFLSRTFATYQTATSYRDQGVVRLSVSINDRIQRETAPLNVSFHNQMFLLSAYDVRMWSDAKQVLLWLEDPTTDHHDSQVRVQRRKSGTRLQLEELLDDTIITERLNAGLAGPAPQLEWLFAPEPMEKLFQSENKIRYDGHETIDGTPCVIVHAQAGDDVYRFFIARDSMLIRRVELPPPRAEVIALATGADPLNVRVMGLELDLVGATLQPPAEMLQRPPMPQRPQWVHALVPLPPSPPSASLGRSLNNVRFGTELERELTSDGTVVVVFVADRVDLTDGGAMLTPHSAQSIASLNLWRQLLPGSMKRRLRSFAIVDNSSIAAELNQPGSLPALVDAQQRFQDATKTRPGDLVIIDGQRKVAWVQSGLNASGLPAFGTVVGDVLNKIEVSQRLHEQWQSDQKAYREKITELSVR